MATFSWAAAADVGLGLLGKGLESLASAGLRKANAEAANLVREGQNEVRRSQANLAATVRDINNRRLMTAASERKDNLTVNAIRMSDAFASRQFEESVQAAEALGRSTSQAALAGLGGAGIRALSQTTSLMLARRQEASRAQGEAAVGDAFQQSVGQMSQAVAGMDVTPTSLGLDTRQADAGGGLMSGLAGSLIRGLLDKRESARVLVGSLYDQPAPVVDSAPRQPGIGSGADFSFAPATSYPVLDSTVQGTPLAPYYATQAEVRRVDNVTLN